MVGMKRNEITSLLLNEKPCKILRLIFNGFNYSSAIAKEADTTYSHAVGIVQDFEEQGLIESKKNGRKKILSLTDKGEKVAKAVSQLFAVIEEESIGSEIDSSDSPISKESL